jgi:ribonuclease BN (tRNA processing enzyme)
MKYEIISSGSKGNCVIINDVMVDCGVPFSKIKNHLYDIRYLLLTHIHSDHIKPATLNNIKSLFPRIKIIGNYEVHQVYGVGILANAGYEIVTDHYKFLPFECVHDVLTYGFTWTFEDIEIIYATDTSSMHNAPKGPYDYLFVESNHSEKKLDMIIGQAKGGYNPYLGGKRHLSTEQAKSFYYTHRKSRESEFIELHKSHRFY